MSDTFLPGSGFDTYEQQDKVLVGLCGGTGLQSSCPHFTAAGLCGDGRCGASVHR